MDLLRAKLEKDLIRITDEFPGVMGVAIKDLSTGDELAVNGNEVFPIASSIKIAVLIEFFRKLEQGTINSKDQLTFLENQKVGGSGILKELGSVTMSLLDYAILMITVSDNSATNICIDLATMEDINETLSQLGLSVTRLVRKMQDKEGLAAGKDWLSTPLEMMKLMDGLYSKRGLSPWVCEESLKILRKPKVGLIGGVIRNSVPTEIEVADKSGWVNGALSDVGIVYLPKRPYVVALLTKHIPSTDPKMLNAIWTMTEVTRHVHCYFSEIDSATKYGRKV